MDEDMAHKFFGNQSPVGKTLVLHADQPVQSRLSLQDKSCRHLFATRRLNNEVIKSIL